MTANDFSFRAATITDVPALAQLHVATIVETHGGPQLRRSRPGPALLYTINLITGAATAVASTAIQAGSLNLGQTVCCTREARDRMEVIYTG